jgi:hypothetical protein
MKRIQLCKEGIDNVDFDDEDKGNHFWLIWSISLWNSRTRMSTFQLISMPVRWWGPLHVFPYRYYMLTKFWGSWCIPLWWFRGQDLPVSCQLSRKFIQRDISPYLCSGDVVHTCRRWNTEASYRKIHRRLNFNLDCRF